MSTEGSPIGGWGRRPRGRPRRARGAGRSRSAQRLASPPRCSGRRPSRSGRPWPARPGRGLSPQTTSAWSPG
eukprot:scaffold473321_cov42-Prasinocladus_malaysianus.AAC.1